MGGTMFDAILDKCTGLPFINEYLHGGIGVDEFKGLVTSHTDSLVSAGMSEWEISLLYRFPRGHHDSLEKLRSAFGISECYDDEFEEYRAYVSQRFAHLPDRFTSIFPEETRNAYELSRIIRPESVVVAGSYYTYLAVWLMPGLQPTGRMVCIDPDASVCTLAEQNMASLGFQRRVEIICDDAVRILGDGDGHIDVLVIDAYGSKEHRSPRFHGKAIYAPIVKAALPRMSAGSVILVHNADESASDLSEFFEAVDDAALAVFLGTTEHLAVFQL